MLALPQSSSAVLHIPVENAKRVGDAMTEVPTHDRATTKPKRKRSNGAAHAPVLVSSYKLAAHFGVARQYIEQLTAEGVIEKRGDGYDQDACRLRYITHLRDERRRSPRAAADAKHAEAKTALLQIRIEEKQRTLVRRDAHEAMIDQMAGLVLTNLHALPVQTSACDGRLKPCCENCASR
jgi:hypothetical protein